MKNTLFIGATELAEILEISRAQSYKIIQKLNSELEKQGYMTLAGKVSRVYFLEKFYGIAS
ncbi:MAG: DNA-binding protein, partial [Anaerovoracaceae bacterium]